AFRFEHSLPPRIWSPVSQTVAVVSPIGYRQTNDPECASTTEKPADAEFWHFCPAKNPVYSTCRLYPFCWTVQSHCKGPERTAIAPSIRSRTSVPPLIVYPFRCRR